MSLKNAMFAKFWNTVGFNREIRVRMPWRTNDGAAYYIVRRTVNWGNAGFFSNYFYALTHIAHAKERGLIPVVDMRNYKTVYSETHSVAGSLNAWEYYFSQPINTGTAYASGDFTLSHGVRPVDSFNPVKEVNGVFNPDFGRISELKSICGDYIAIRKELKDGFDVFFDSKLSGGRTLGVHYRGTDKRIPPGKHRCSIPFAQLLDDARGLAGDMHADRIFLATDEEDVASALEEAVGVPVISAPAYRMVAGSHAAAHTSSPRRARPDHRYMLGVEVLRDAYLLSRCDGLLHGSSNVTCAAIFLRGTEFPFRRYIKTEMSAK